MTAIAIDIHELGDRVANLEEDIDRASRDAKAALPDYDWKGGSATEAVAALCRQLTALTAERDGMAADLKRLRGADGQPPERENPAETPPAILSIANLQEENASLKRDIANAVKWAKEYCPDYPWKDGTASEVMWCLGESYKGATRACDDLRKELAALKQSKAGEVVENQWIAPGVDGKPSWVYPVEQSTGNTLPCRVIFTPPAAKEPEPANLHELRGLIAGLPEASKYRTKLTEALEELQQRRESQLAVDGKGDAS